MIQKRSTDILLALAISTEKEKYDPLFLSNYVTLNVLDELKRTKGVGEASCDGYAELLHAHLVASGPHGAAGGHDQRYSRGYPGAERTICCRQNRAGTGTLISNWFIRSTPKAGCWTPEQFGNIILRADGPQGVLYLKDVARIELGAQSYDVRTALNGEPGAGMPDLFAARRQCAGNDRRAGRQDGRIEETFSRGNGLCLPYDTSLFVKASVWEVVKTLGEAMVLVILVVYLFLQSWRATLIPIIAVPISLIGTFAGLWLFGFSINTLTLFAMVLSIGIVVDDAIVVLENIERLMDEEKLSPMKAAIKSMEQVASAVVAIVLVLCAVFVPVAFMGGIAGELYRQFAVTVAVAVTISGVVALTLTPALCAILLRHTHGESAFFRAFNNGFGRLTNFYVHMVGTDHTA